jgi:hypothetical protein
MTNRSTRVLTILFLVLTMLTLTSACEPGPPPPIPWFTEHMEIEPVSLPEGVDVQVVLRTDTGVIHEYLVVTNTSPTPLYLTGEPMTGNTTFEPFSVELPASTGPVLKIVSGQAFYWGPILDTSNSPARMGWEPEESYGRPDAVWLYIFTNRLSGGGNVILNLEPRNQFDGHRPANVDIPGPQTVLLPLVYSEQIFNVPITISYTLNPGYYEYEVVEPSVLCALSIGVLLATILCGSFVYRRLRRNRLNKLDA